MQNKIKVVCTTGQKCLYSLLNCFEINFVHIFIKPQINLNLFKKETAIDRFPYNFLKL